jgi:O-antigen/teichoic acid export membrane protein
VSDAAAKHSFLRHAAVYGLGQILLYAGPLLLVPMVTRSLNKEDYGALTALQRLGDILNLCLLFGGLRQAAIAIYTQSEPARRRRVTGTTTVLAAVLAVVGGFIALGGSAVGADRIEVAPRLLLLAAAAALMEGVCYVLLALPQAREESRMVVAATVLQLLLRIALTGGFVVGLGWGAEGVLSAGALASGLTALALTVREGRRGSLIPDPTVLRDLFRFALPFLPGGLCLFLLNNGDRFLIWHWAGLAAVGVYDLGYRLALACYNMSVGPLNMVWGARMYQAAREPDAPAVFGRTVRRILSAYTFVGLVACLFADEAVRILGAGRYPGAAEVIPPVSLGFWFLAAATLFDAPFYLRRRTGLKTLVSLASAVAVTGFYTLLIPPYGGIGAAWATVAGFAFQAALTRAVGQRLFHVRYEDARMAGSLGVAVGLWMLSRFLPVGPCPATAKVFLGMLYPACLWALCLVSPEEVAETRLGLIRFRAIVRRYFLARV